jgi:hypothetical protein
VQEEGEESDAGVAVMMRRMRRRRMTMCLRRRMTMCLRWMMTMLLRWMMTMSTDAETGVALMSLRGGWMRRLEYAQGEVQV